MPTDTSEKGLESLIMRHMTGGAGFFSGSSLIVAEETPSKSGNGWFAGNPADYDNEYAVDAKQLFAFLMATQPVEFVKLGIGDYADKKSITGQKFLARLQGEINRRVVIDVLRKGKYSLCVRWRTQRKSYTLTCRRIEFALPSRCRMGSNGLPRHEESHSKAGERVVSDAANRDLWLWSPFNRRSEDEVSAAL